jgi:LCP family protein required for cell wall assembly
LTLEWAWDTLKPVARNTSSLRPLPASPRAGLRQRLLLALVILLFAAGAAYGALVLATRVDEMLFPGNGISLPISLPGTQNSSDAPSSIGKRINVLVLGLDRRPREGNIFTRTDTMIVVTIDPQTKTAGILGIPRDLYVKIPDGDGGNFEERINTALEYGETYKYPGGGPKLAEDTIAQNLGIKIDYYVIIDFSAFKEVIDSLGGIDVDVPDPLYDSTYSDTELPGDYFPLDFSPGMQHMDGRTALGYARSRNTTSDLDRIQRQQRVIFAVMDKALNLNVLTNAVDLWHKYKDTIDTDINDVRIPGFAKLALDIPQDRISALSLGPCTTPWTTPAGAAVLLPSEEGCARIVQALFADQQLSSESAVVEVRDGTSSTDDVAAKVKGLLVNLGFPEGSVVESEPPADGPVVETEILDFTGKTYSAEKVAEWLAVPATAVRDATSLDADLRTTNADIVVILGDDADVSALNSDFAGG